MFGTNRRLMTRQCYVCKRHVAMRVDPDDVRRVVEEGVFVQHAFVDRNDKPYLTPSERELWVSSVCADCWSLLCPADPLAYC